MAPGVRPKRSPKTRVNLAWPPDRDAHGGRHAVGAQRREMPAVFSLPDAPVCLSGTRPIHRTPDATIGKIIVTRS